MTSSFAEPGVVAGVLEDDNELPPLYVDLDGCLIRTDLLVESFLFAARRVDIWLRLPLWLARGKAHLKAQLAARAEIDPALLPYNASLVNYLRAERQKGRRIVLATASHRHLAEAVATHLGCFDAVIASDETSNLRGLRKLEAIRANQGNDDPFCYAGNDRTDLVIWRAAHRAVIVNAPRRVAAIASKHTEVEFAVEDRPPPLKHLFRALRPHQWIKNFLIFIPLLASGAFFDVEGWVNALLAFAAFSATASGIYILNDLADINADRKHPRKRLRPFASGAVQPALGIVAAIGLLGGGLILAAHIGATTLALIIVYAVTSIAYSLYLKEQPLVDVFTLSFLYNVRLFVGGEATAYRVSLWLLGFAFFLFLGLALIKRVTELRASELMPANKQIPNRGYYPSDVLILGLMGVAASFTSSIVLALYLQDRSAQAIYANPVLLWPLVPLLLFWQCRLWLSTQRGYMHDDPIIYSARDWVSWLVAGIAGALIALAHQRGIILP
jgi:4-hydroxybenzoate polyprenyltransferase/phosphoserine phosphatase